jgi:ABC-type multidrug transport system fused ATPase/permease subunit
VSHVLKDVVVGCARDHPWLSGISVASALLIPAQDVLLPHLIGQLVNAVRTHATHADKSRKGGAMAAAHSPAVRRAFIALALAVAAVQAAYVGVDYVDARAYPAMMTYVRRRMLACVLDTNDVGQSGELSTGELVTQFIKVPWTVTNWFESSKSTLPHALVFVAATAYFFWLDRQLGVCMFVAMVATGLALVVSLKSCGGVSERRDEAMNDVQEHIDEVLRNLPAIYAGGQKQQEQDALRPLESLFERMYVRTMMCSSEVKLWLVPTAIGMVAFVIWRCLRLLADGRMSVGLFVSVLAVVMYLMASMMRLVAYSRTLVYYWGVIKASAGMLACPMTMPATPKQKAQQQEQQQQQQEEQAAGGPPQGHAVVALRGVTYVHPKGKPDAPAVRDATLDVRVGDRLAIVGEIGSGKTTMLRLMLRLIEPTRGALALAPNEDGALISYERLGTQEVRRAFGYVPQNASLFDRTVLENVVYGAASDRPTEAAVWDAAKSLGLEGVLEALPDGLATRCGKGGSSLSGGQRQAVWLIRMRLRHPEVLVLDEPTSAMDPANRDVVAAAIVRGFKTVVFVSHDEALVKAAANRVVTMSAGAIKSDTEGMPN